MFARLACAISHAAGRPWATALAFASIVVWAAFGPLFDYSESWQLVINTGTTIITFLMAFLIQASQNRDGAAIQAKLDELIRASEARDEFIGLDKRSETEIESVRKEEQG